MQVLLEEQALGDGLQAESRLFSLTEKLELVRLLARAGVRRLQLGSFVNPRSVPQLANADVLVAMVRIEFPDMVCTGQILNEKGLERALRSGLTHLSVSVPAPDSRRPGDQARQMAETMEALIRLTRQAVAQGITLRAVLLDAFAGLEEGGREADEALATAGEMITAGAAEISLADTAGLAHPHGVRALAQRFLAAYPQTELSLHLHDNRGLGLVNLYAGLEAGVRRFDVAAGGLGGSPQAPSLGGNVATEDAVHLFTGMGIETGMDLPLLCQAVTGFESLLARPLPGRMSRLSCPSAATD